MIDYIRTTRRWQYYRDAPRALPQGAYRLSMGDDLSPVCMAAAFCDKTRGLPALVCRSLWAIVRMLEVFRITGRSRAAILYPGDAVTGH
ncbi:hypothetical protein KCP73_25345 [Salmonella enterica subsp. enterica]|nr:hypothetical protein KCP73_25345 [Salmonella enterica subsp. enterica]